MQRLYRLGYEDSHPQSHGVAFLKAQYPGSRNVSIYMKITRYIILTLIALFGLIVSSCISDDFDDSPGISLGFSADTVNFGVVFTDLGTPTARLRVYNRNKKSVNISSIEFRNSDTPFTLNVDGVSGRRFRDVEIRGGDSIYVFIECFITPDASAEPRRVADQLVFVTNGTSQEVEVEAWGLNVKRLNAMKVDRDMVLTPEIPYIVFDSLTVEEGATLEIRPGTRVLFHDKASLVVRGTLKAVGEPGAMIDMRGDRIDDVLPGVGYDILAGQWGGITIAPQSFGNRMEYVDMRSTSQGLRIDSCGDVTKQKLTLVNSWLHNSQSSVLESLYAKVDAYGCCFSEAPRAVVSLTGGEHKFVQCTIANYYLFSAVTQPNLSLFHLMPDEAADNGSPLMKASFENCIVYGLGTSVSPGDLAGADVYYRNVLIKENVTADDNFIDCIGDEDPLFMTVRSDYYFNYRLKEGSPAIGVGNPDFVTPLCRYDMFGLDRLADGNPALGAYVYVPEE